MNVDDDRLLTPKEVAAMLRVDAVTVGRWADAGHLTCVRTPGGRRRYWESEIRALIAGEPVPQAVDAA